MEIYLLIGNLILSCAAIVLALLFRPRKQDSIEKVDLSNSLNLIDQAIKTEFRETRLESSKISQENRLELNNMFKDFIGDQKLNFTELKTEQANLIKATVDGLEKISSKIEEKISKIINQSKEDSIQMRDSMSKSLKEFQFAFDKNVESFNSLQREKFSNLESKQVDLIQNTEKKLESIRVTVEEKLEKTLSERLGQSFETVGKQLIEVQKGLGEMQSLANDVGGLKKVLSNVKMRGSFGEVQLQMLLEQILAPDQYEKNVKIKQGSKENVEFAIKLPGDGITGQPLLLPIDAKFPKEVYESLQNSLDSATTDSAKDAHKVFETAIKKMAKDICEKYIDPPRTTDFAIMFLPFESIYSQVVSNASLLESLQRDCKVIVTGPTTLAAILNSLQMGFKTLAIQKRSSEVWQVLGSVKKEFDSFGGLLQKAQSNFQTGLGQLDDVLGVRTRAIQKKLKAVESLTTEQANLIISAPSDLQSVDDE